MFYEHQLGSRMLLSGRTLAYLFIALLLLLTSQWHLREQKNSATRLVENYAGGGWGGGQVPRNVLWSVLLTNALGCDISKSLWHYCTGTQQAAADSHVLALVLEEGSGNAICIQGMNPHFQAGAEGEPSHRDFSQHLSLSLYLPLTQPQFAFIHLKQWRRPEYFNWTTPSLDLIWGINTFMNMEHEMRQNCWLRRQLDWVTSSFYMQRTPLHSPAWRISLDHFNYRYWLKLRNSLVRNPSKSLQT